MNRLNEALRRAKLRANDPAALAALADRMASRLALQDYQDLRSCDRARLLSERSRAERQGNSERVAEIDRALQEQRP